MLHFDADQWSVLPITVIFGAARLIVAAVAWREPRSPEDGRGCCHAGDSSNVSWGTNSLPLVSGLNTRVTTNAMAAPVVAISIGTAKPSCWPTAHQGNTGPVKPAQLAHC